MAEVLKMFAQGDTLVAYVEVAPGVVETMSWGPPPSVADGEERPEADFARTWDERKQAALEEIASRFPPAEQIVVL